ncbi:MAG: exo-alpha-sialidase [Acidimicrobiia bacterium]|nr:exo-alpha-sialidase [Acidimicrobiia bacterium]
MRGFRGLSVVLALALGLLATLPPATSAAAASADPGCQGLAAPVAHRAGGQTLAPPPGGAPQACGVGTGFPAAESHIVAMNDGAIVFTPAVLPSGTIGTGEPAPIDPDTQGNASPAGVAVTTDNGALWAAVKPFDTTWNPTDHGDYVDAATGRLFFEDYGPIPQDPKFGANQEGPAHIMWSDDRSTWHHSAISNLVLPENPRFTVAKAPAGQPQPTGYPNVVYFCANTNVGFTSPAILGRFCYRSLDGGSTWAVASQLFSAVGAKHPECGLSGETFTAIDGYYPEPTSDGDLYVLVNCGGKTYLARSTDEGSTFPIVHTASGPLTVAAPPDSVTALGSGPQFRIGADDTFYLMTPTVSGGQIRKILVRTSSDRGLTWSAPVDVTAPGVASILRWNVTERGTELAFAYLGQKAGQKTWDAYVTATRDFSAPGGPVFWSAITNTQPLLYGDDIMGAGYIALGQGEIQVPYPFPLGIQKVGVAAGNDFMGVTIAPDNSVWGSFNQDCGPTPQSAGCAATHDQTRGFVGRLAWLPAAQAATPAAVRQGAPSASVGARRASLPATGERSALPLIGLGVCAAGMAVRNRRRHRHARGTTT